MSLQRIFRAAAAVLLLAAPGCGDDSPSQDTGLDCGPGTSTQVDGVAACIIQNELLIETGFMCDPRLQRYEGDEITVCSEDPLSEEQLNELEGFDADPNPDRPFALDTTTIEGTECLDLQMCVKP